MRAWLWALRNPQLTLTAVLATALAGIAAVAYWSVVEVRAQRNSLEDEAQRAEIANAELSHRAGEVRKELGATETQLTERSTALGKLQRTLADANRDYKAIVAAQEAALEHADAATRELGVELDSARSERDVAQLNRAMYEEFWTRSRADADQAVKDRDQASTERDAARKERDQAATERDAAIAGRRELEAQRLQLTADRDHAESARRAAEVEVARLVAALARATGDVPSTGVGSGSAAGSAAQVGSGATSATPPAATPATDAGVSVVTAGPDAR